MEWREGDICGACGEAERDKIAVFCNKFQCGLLCESEKIILFTFQYGQLIFMRIIALQDKKNNIKLKDLNLITQFSQQIFLNKACINAA